MIESLNEVPIVEQGGKKVQVDQIENGRPGDWVCPNCNDHNYSFREFCRKCFHTKAGEKKVIEEGKKPGDWNCENCAHLNYQWRIECQKCQRKKPWKAGDTNSVGKNPNDWMCPNCGDHVFASRSACRKCNTPKHMAMRNGYMMGQNSFAARQAMQSGRPGDWNCPTCGEKQYAFRSECRRCKTTKPIGMPGMGMPGMGMHGMGMHGMGMHGMGMHGMGMHGMGMQGMGMQGMGNQGYVKQGRPGDWNCPSCNDQQYAFRIECRKCGTSKPVGAGVRMNVGGNQRRAGDWDCPACNDMQYASRTECRRCGTQKPQ